MLNLEQYLSIFNGSLAEGKCDGCKAKTFSLCQDIHPEWFTKKRREPKVRHERDIDRYVEEFTLSRIVLELSDINDETGHVYERCCLCDICLAQFTEQLRGENFRHFANSEEE